MLRTLETYHLPTMGAAEDAQHERTSVLTPAVAVLPTQADRSAAVSSAAALAR
jgi:hypothetical protein